MNMAQKSDNMQLIDAWRQRVWGDQDASAIAELFEDDGTAGGLGREALSGPPEFGQFHAAICALMSNTWLHIGEFLEQGDKMACLASFGGKCRKTGKDVKIEGSMFVEFRKGKILHCANHFEFMDLYEQLGLLPQESFAKALGGQSVA